jgi:hypothetical protein
VALRLCRNCYQRLYYKGQLRNRLGVPYGPPTPCRIIGCPWQVTSNGWCKWHARAWAFRGRRRQGRTAIDPFERWQRHVHVVHPAGCWWWTGGTVKGYGKFNIRHRSARLPTMSTTSAHRFGYKALIDPDLPDELQIDHLCRNTLCVNPDHLEAVTPEENIRRAVAVRRR